MLFFRFCEEVKFKWAEANSLPSRKLHKCEFNFITSNCVWQIDNRPHVYKMVTILCPVYMVFYVSEWYECELQPQNIKLNRKFNVWWKMKYFRSLQTSLPSTGELEGQFKVKSADFVARCDHCARFYVYRWYGKVFFFLIVLTLLCPKMVVQ